MFRSNLQDREDAISALGEDVFYSAEENLVYKDIPIPVFFSWIFSVYIEAEGMCGEDGLTWSELADYCRLRGIRLSQYEISVLTLIHWWASDERYKIREESTSELKDKKEHDEGKI